MRLSILVLLAACGSSASFDDDTCPGTVTEGEACSFSGRCWHDDNFSSCMSGWCTCRAGHVSCDSLAPQDGDACSDEPITQCTYEGNPSCTTLPTSEACSCDETGTWRCSCFCYGGMTTCEVDPCSRYPQTINHAYCADHGLVCTYPGNTTCRCEEATPGAEWQFNCN